MAIPYDLLSDSEATSPGREEKAEEEETMQLEGVEVGGRAMDRTRYIQADVEIIWREEPAKEEHVLHDVIIKLNGEPVTVSEVA